MKVLYINVGITHYTHPLLEKIVLKGCELTMLLPQKDDGTIGEGVKLVGNIKKSYKIIYSRSKKKWYGKTALIDLKTILLQEEPNILMICWPYLLQLFFDRSIFTMLKTNNIKLIIQEIPFQTAPYKKIEYYKQHPVYNENMELKSRGIAFYLRTMLTMYVRKQIYLKTDATVNYASCAYNILPSYGVDPKSIFVRYNTGDTDSLFKQYGEINNSKKILKECPRVLHIGRLVKWKRVDLLIDAFKLVLEKYPDCELMIIGDGPEKENLIQQSLNLGLKDHVIFTGAVYDAYLLGQYMNESSVYVLAGMGGLSINDAMAFSLPIICSVCDGTEKDLVTNGVNGYFFREGDCKDLSDKIVLVLSDKEKAKKMGNKSYTIIKEKINLDTVSQRYMDVFNYVLKNK